MDTIRLKANYQKKVVMDNNILTDFLELTAALYFDFMDILNQLFIIIIIPMAIIDDEIVVDNLGSLVYKEGFITNEVGYRMFIKLGDSSDKMAKRLSEYDRHLIAIAAEADLMVVSNDNPVREICKKYDIKITGTIGIISSAYENKLISFEVMKNAFVFLFSDNSSCYLSSRLKYSVFNHYSINDEI